MSSQPRKTILVAEENADVRELMKIFFELHNYTVVEAKDGAEAVRVAHAELPNLILMDLNMPVADGIYAIVEIRRNPALSKIPILVNSADGNRGIDFFLNIEKFGTGFIEYLTKPLNYRELNVLIESILINQNKLAA